jgi:hypothetical protein
MGVAMEVTSQPSSEQGYDVPTMIVAGTVGDLTAGPITTYDESPSGMKGTKDNKPARAEADD